MGCCLLSELLLGSWCACGFCFATDSPGGLCFLPTNLLVLSSCVGALLAWSSDTLFVLVLTSGSLQHGFGVLPKHSLQLDALGEHPTLQGPPVSVLLAVWRVTSHPPMQACRVISRDYSIWVFLLEGRPGIPWCKCWQSICHSWKMLPLELLAKPGCLLLRCGARSHPQPPSFCLQDGLQMKGFPEIAPSLPEMLAFALVTNSSPPILLLQLFPLLEVMGSSFSCCCCCCFSSPLWSIPTWRQSTAIPESCHSPFTLSGPRASLSGGNPLTCPCKMDPAPPAGR